MPYVMLNRVWGLKSIVEFVPGTIDGRRVNLQDTLVERRLPPGKRK